MFELKSNIIIVAANVNCIMPIKHIAPNLIVIV